MNDTLACQVTAIDLADTIFFQSKFSQYSDLNAILSAFNDDYEPGWNSITDMPTNIND